MAWFLLVIASLGEVVGVTTINLYVRTKSFIWLLAMALSFAFGFYFLALAMRDIPMGTAYAVWTGLGAAGAVLIGMLFFRESVSLKRMLFLVCIIGGAVGLKVLG